MKKRLLGFFRDNLLLKLLSLGFAIVLWVYVSVGQTELESSARVAVETKNLPKRLVRVSDLPNELEIKVRGPRNMLRGLRDRSLSYAIDLSRATAGTMSARVYPPNIEGLPKGARVTEISPSQIQLKLAERKSKTVHVKPIFRGKLPEGLEIQRLTVEPELVEVAGPKDEIDPLNEVSTETIDLADHNENFAVEVGLDLIGQHIETVREQRIKVAVQIGEPKIKKTFYGVAIEVRNTSYESRLARRELDVQLEGSKEQLQQLTPGDLRLIIDAGDLEPGHAYDLVPVLKAPEGMSFRNVNLPPVHVVILEKLKKNSGKEKP
jgi:YbbR domain-containing protein